MRSLLWAQGAAGEPNVGPLASRPPAGPAVFGATYYASDTAQGFECVETAESIFAWALSINVGNPAWAAQANWYIDPVNGADTNDGTSAITALKTLTEWFRRVRIRGVLVNITINLLPPPLGIWPVDDIPEGALTCAPFLDFGVTVLGAGAVSLVRNGVFSASTPFVAATNTERRATDSLGAAWPINSGAASGKRIRITTAGANFNAECWPDSDVGAGVATLSEPVLTTIGTWYLAALKTIVAGNTYAYEQLPIMPRWAITIPNGSLYFSDVAFDYPTSFADCSYIEFANCDLGASSFDSGVQWIAANCRWTGFSNIFNGVLVAGVHIGGGLYASGPFGYVDLRYKVKNATSFFCEGCARDLEIPSVQVFSSNARPGITCRVGTMPLFPAVGNFGPREIVGSGSTGYGITVSNGSQPRFETDVTGFYLTGALGNVGIGTPLFTRTYAQLPYIRSDIAAGAGTAFAGFVKDS